MHGEIACRGIVYIVGHSRGGTTWLGSLIGAHPDVRYVFEPFASQAHSYTGIDTQALFNNNRRYQQDKLTPKIEYPSPLFFNMNPNIAELDRFKPLVRFHLSTLIRQYFGDVSSYYIALKQPRLENLGWAVETTGADIVIMIDRHPFGIINSYQRGGFWKWLELEYPLAERTVPETHPQFAYLFESIRTVYEKLLVLTYLRSEIARDYCRQHDYLVVAYRELCFQPIEWMRRIIDTIGVTWSDAYEMKIDELTHPTEISDGWLDTRKNPELRAEAWRRELPVTLVAQLSKFIDDNRIDVPYPGAGLPELTSEELQASAHYNRMLRWTNLRQKVGKISRCLGIRQL